ncbi:MAG: hypothetical protein WCV73_04435 [Patescibacteria group bacterium]|jgi:hypothetical protein
MKHNWSIICGGSIIDQDTNQISLINALEQLNLPKEAFGKPLNISFHVISYFTEADTSKEKKIEQVIKLLDPQNNLIKKVEIPVTIPEKFGRFRLRNVIKGMDISIPGMYKFLLSIKEGNDKLVDIAELEIEVLLKK